MTDPTEMHAVESKYCIVIVLTSCTIAVSFSVVLSTVRIRSLIGSGTVLYYSKRSSHPGTVEPGVSARHAAVPPTDKPEIKINP